MPILLSYPRCLDGWLPRCLVALLPRCLVALLPCIKTKTPPDKSGRAKRNAREKALPYQLTCGYVVTLLLVDEIGLYRIAV